MSWGSPREATSAQGITCCYCGRRAPRDGRLFVRIGWQVRYDYPFGIAVLVADGAKSPKRLSARPLLARLRAAVDAPWCLVLCCLGWRMASLRTQPLQLDGELEQRILRRLALAGTPGHRSHRRPTRPLSGLGSSDPPHEARTPRRAARRPTASRPSLRASSLGEPLRGHHSTVRGRRSYRLSPFARSRFLSNAIGFEP